MSPAEAVDVLEHYGIVILPALVVAEQFGIPLPAVPALLGFGALAAQGRGSIPLMLVALVAVALTVDFGWYALGRRRGAPLLALGSVASRWSRISACGAPTRSSRGTAPGRCSSRSSFPV